MNKYDRAMRRDMRRNMQDMRDRHYSYGRDYHYNDMAESRGRYDYATYQNRDNARDYRDNQRVREYNGSYGNTPFEMTSREDYKLERDDIDLWVEKLIRELEQDEKSTFRMETVIRKAKELGERFDNYNEDELYAATLMIYTDYKNRLGKNNIDMAIKLARDFLNDKDSALQGAEKLATYYDCIILGE